MVISKINVCVMKTKDKIRDLSKMGEQELRNVLGEKKEKMRQFRFDLAAGKIKDVREVRETRRDIARVSTLLNSAMIKK